MKRCVTNITVILSPSSLSLIIAVIIKVSLLTQAGREAPLNETPSCKNQVLSYYLFTVKHCYSDMPVLCFNTCIININNKDIYQAHIHPSGAQALTRSQVITNGVSNRYDLNLVFKQSHITL